MKYCIGMLSLLLSLQTAYAVDKITADQAVEQGDVNTSPLREEYWQTLMADPATQAWFEEDNKYFLHQSLSTPVLNVLVKAEGPYLYDMQGNRYLDMHGNGVHNGGFNNPEVIAAVKAQLDSGLTFTPRRYTNAKAIGLARKLVEIAPGGMSRTLFAPGGSEAIEMALMLAKQITGKYKTISFWDSYHGTTMGAASVSGEELFKGGLGPMVPGALHVEFPNYYRNPWGFQDTQKVDDEILRQIEVILQREPDVAALIGEPVSAKPVVPSQYFWQGVRKLCDRYGVMLIFDEVITGLGRSGKMFASEHFVTPDILVLGKSLGGGLVPMAAILTHEKYNILQHRSIGHYTHEKNALSSAAGIAEIEYLQKNEVVAHTAQLGAYTLEKLKLMQSKHPIIGNVAGLGLHMGVDLVKDQTTKERATEAAEWIMFECMKKGLSFKIIEGNVITLRPALIITQEQMDWALTILDETLTEAEQRFNIA